jgi:HPt (histidine-containing phosphotransfer) domain-containing protein
MDQCMGDVSSVMLILDEFQKQIVEDMPDLESNVASRNGARTAALAHALKGASGVLSAGAVQRSAAELERLARAGNLDNADALLSKLRDEVSQCIQFIPEARKAASDSALAPTAQGQ